MEMVTAFPPSLTEQQLEQKFKRLATEWKRATAILSAGDVICMHPAYQQIIGMGPAVLPLIFRELERDVDHWFWALHSITGVDPLPESSHGNMNEMARTWLAWGRENGFA